DPHKASIATVQLYAGGERAFVFAGEAIRRLINSHWLSEQRLVAHNALFETAFLQKHADFAPAQPMKCTMQASGLLYGAPRSLTPACVNVIGAEPPKALQLSCWSAPRLSAGQIAYAASDAALTWYLWTGMASELRDARRFAAYELARDAIPAVADMQLRGLGFDPEEHARQADGWSRALADARREYLN